MAAIAPPLAYMAVTVATLALLRGLLHRGIRASLAAPRVPHDRAPDAFELPYDSVRIDTANERRLHAWLIAPAKSGDTLAPAVIVMHGWGGNAAMMLPLARPLHEASFATLFIDARCHGATDGDSFASLPRFAEDLEHAFEWLATRPGIGSEQWSERFQTRLVRREVPKVFSCRSASVGARHRLPAMREFDDSVHDAEETIRFWSLRSATLVPVKPNLLIPRHIPTLPPTTAARCPGFSLCATWSRAAPSARCAWCFAGNSSRYAPPRRPIQSLHRGASTRRVPAVGYSST
jgi:hypothetical protein